jgi:hypothetical protein
VPIGVNLSCQSAKSISHPTSPKRGSNPCLIEDSRLKLTSGTNVSNGLEARSTKNQFDCGVGVPPARKRLVDNGARSQLKPTEDLPETNTYQLTLQSSLAVDFRSLDRGLNPA